MKQEISCLSVKLPGHTSIFPLLQKFCKQKCNSYERIIHSWVRFSCYAESNLLGFSFIKKELLPSIRLLR